MSVRVAVDGDRLDAQFLAGAHYADGDLAAVRDQYLVEHSCRPVLGIRTSFCRSGAIDGDAVVPGRLRGIEPGSTDVISAGNPYVLPSVLVGAAVYLGLSFLTDASVLVRVAVLVAIAGVVPVVVNRVASAVRGEEAVDSGADPEADPDADPEQ
ncbi:hypothetical protein GCM10008992_13070 [Halorubrum aquaticum]